MRVFVLSTIRCRLFHSTRLELIGPDSNFEKILFDQSHHSKKVLAIQSRARLMQSTSLRRRGGGVVLSLISRVSLSPPPSSTQNNHKKG